MRTSLLLLACAMLEAVKGLALSSLGLARPAAVVVDRHAQACVCMGCRNNLKKEKRQRNRVNAFRFKKGGFGKKRFNNYEDRAAAAAKASDDAAFMSMIFTYSAAAEADAAAAEKEAAKQEA
mmetsp:Transcript_21626/g.26563  ORF Transcript_21626/g.26563 Transcript_21626/m.26563 type:complete len:122 (-) Transcript_21626:448-813(-)